MAGNMDVLRRWTAFNLVGAAGIAVQLGVLAALVHVLHLPALLSTALAVEAAILHNFAWHQRWTWKDRPADAAGVAGRLARFHLLNGLVSLAGNLAIVALLTRSLGTDPVVASSIAIVCCALVNFAASERLVFRAAAAALAVVILPGAASAGPTPATVAAWDRYAAAVDASLAAASSAGGFFVRDARDKGDWRGTARRGDLATFQIDTPSAPDGRIHHWIGGVFVAGVTLDDVLRKLEAGAGRESESYEDVLASKLLARDGSQYRIFMKLRRSAILTVTYNTEHEVEYRRLSPTRATARSVATRIAELANAGTKNEREKGPGDDNGFLWRLNAYWRYEQVDGGVLIECESVSLSRVVPFAVRLFVSPIVERIARESLERTLVSLRAALSGKRS